MTYKFELNNLEIIDVEVDNIEAVDYPDFCNAYISEAKYKCNNKPLSDNELSDLMDKNPMAFGDACHEEFICIADRY
tara:strand:- start:215 stop:445 length:231 start_codon:yes stop_codon:yes gene_type:complete